ncbi:hypothetical protein LTR56_012000 [Elasticomyces elasticus]|nr:hypothetical protein LTR22_018099 [Elasticomyces elasticus]KAK3640204.1 hypothetical protein LTR56_012000 [Elasticomyces elasticus]KAK5751361.1 hypothetical protein LTS12_018599 [Elasticomyces elasticus]
MDLSQRLDSFAAQLTAFRRLDTEYRSSLSSLLISYETLVAENRSLKAALPKGDHDTGNQTFARTPPAWRRPKDTPFRTGPSPTDNWNAAGAKHEASKSSLPAEDKSNASTHEPPGSQATPGRINADFASQLPKSIPNGKIAVNRIGHRLDVLVPSIPDSLRERYRQIYKEGNTIRRLCNSFHIVGVCLRGEPGELCDYDHSPLLEDVSNLLKSLSYNHICKKEGACRRSHCSAGHICQRGDCEYRGGKYLCKFPREIHELNLEVSEFEDAYIWPRRLAQNGGDDEADVSDGGVSITFDDDEGIID